MTEEELRKNLVFLIKNMFRKVNRKHFMMTYQSLMCP